MNPLKFNLTDFELNTVVSPTEVKHVTWSQDRRLIDMQIWSQTHRYMYTVYACDLISEPETHPQIWYMWHHLRTGDSQTCKGHVIWFGAGDSLTVTVHVFWSQNRRLTDIYITCDLILEPEIHRQLQDIWSDLRSRES
jgi:hypothetical protein